MPKNQFERMMFALITVVITVHAYVFYSLYVVNGSFFMQKYVGRFLKTASCFSKIRHFPYATMNEINYKGNSRIGGRT